METKSLVLPIKGISEITNLQVWDKVLITGKLYLFRDQVHKKIAAGQIEQISGLDFSGSGVYYCAATPPKESFVIGACGPTSSYRMDDYTESVLKLGFRVMIGKGYRSKQIVSLCKKYQSVYLITYGGCGALLNQYVKEMRVVAYEELGTEAMVCVLVKNFPAYVAIDCFGRKIWK